jgi:hypothetical protein
VFVSPARRTPRSRSRRSSTVPTAEGSRRFARFMSRRMLGTPPARDVLQEIPVADGLPSIAHGMFMRADAPFTQVRYASVHADRTLFSSVG